MTDYVTLPFYKGRALEDELKVHATLKEAKIYAKKYLVSHLPSEGYTIEISEF